MDSPDPALLKDFHGLPERRGRSWASAPIDRNLPHGEKEPALQATDWAAPFEVVVLGEKRHRATRGESHVEGIEHREVIGSQNHRSARGQMISAHDPGLRPQDEGRTDEEVPTQGVGQLSFMRVDSVYPGMGDTVYVESVKTRTLLVRAGVELLEETSSPDVGLREIARRAGVSHGAPRRWFPTHRSLLAAIASEGLEDLSSELLRAGAGFPEASCQSHSRTSRSPVADPPCSR